jgi:hypothetical protein
MRRMIPLSRSLREALPKNGTSHSQCRCETVTVPRAAAARTVDNGRPCTSDRSLANGALVACRRVLTNAGR